MDMLHAVTAVAWAYGYRWHETLCEQLSATVDGIIAMEAFVVGKLKLMILS